MRQINILPPEICTPLNVMVPPALPGEAVSFTRCWVGLSSELHMDQDPLWVLAGPGSELRLLESESSRSNSWWSNQSQPETQNQLERAITIYRSAKVFDMHVSFFCEVFEFFKFEVQSIYNLILVSGVQYRDSVFLVIMLHSKSLAVLPVL